MINEIKHVVHSMSLLPPLFFIFRSCMFSPTKTAELDFSAYACMKVVIFKNCPVGRELKFSGVCGFRCEFVDS